ncbi:MAG: biotin transporter BioY [Methanosarcinales archaeon]
MNAYTYIDQYKNLRYKFFKWRYESNLIYKFGLVFGMACLTGLSAQLRIYLPFTPVPITGQVFLVLLSGVLLGKWYGGLSQGVYAGLGGAGIPWFAPKAGMPIFSSGGMSVLTGVTGGYIIGFIAASFVIGWFTESYLKARHFKYQLLLMLIGVLIIYAYGALFLSVVMHTGFQETMILAVLPFIPLDIAKAMGVAAISTAILPKESYIKG